MSKMPAWRFLQKLLIAGADCRDDRSFLQILLLCARTPIFVPAAVFSSATVCSSPSLPACSSAIGYRPLPAAYPRRSGMKMSSRSRNVGCRASRPSQSSTMRNCRTDRGWLSRDSFSDVDTITLYRVFFRTPNMPMKVTKRFTRRWVIAFRLVTSLFTSHHNVQFSLTQKYRRADNHLHLQ